MNNKGIKKLVSLFVIFTMMFTMMMPIDVVYANSAPTVTSIAPNSGPTAGGTTVTINGSGFSTTPEAITVDFGTTLTSSFSIVSDTQITATSPPGTPGSKVDITVTTASGTSSMTAADKFSYSLLSETLTVNNPATTGFAVSLNPPLAGLAASNFNLLDSSNNPVTITGAITSDNGATYAISAALSAGQTYTVTATDTGYTFGTAQSVVVPTAPTITTQPTNSAVTVGGTASLSIVASGSGSLSYQWYSNTTSSTTGGTSINGATSATYVAPTTTAGTNYYYCIVTNTVGISSATITSNAVNVLVTATLSPRGVFGTVSLPGGATTPISISGSVNVEPLNGGNSFYANFIIPAGGSLATYSITIPNDASLTGYRVSYWLNNDGGYAEQGYYSDQVTTNYTLAKIFPVSTGETEVNIQLLVNNTISGIVSLPNGVVVPSGGMQVTIFIQNGGTAYGASATIPEGGTSGSFSRAVPAFPGYIVSYELYNKYIGFQNEGYYSTNGMTNASAASLIDLSSRSIGGVNMTLLTCSPAAIQQVSAANGQLTLTMNGIDPAWGTTGPTTSMFNVTESINGGTPIPVNASYPGGTNVTLNISVPTIVPTTAVQSIVYYVSYMNELPVSANAFTVPPATGGSTTLAFTSAPNLPQATLSTPYSYTLVVTGGSGGYTFSLPIPAGEPSNYPDGLSLSSNGVFSGTPIMGGTWDGILVIVKDTTGSSITGSFNLTVATNTSATLSLPRATLANATVGATYTASISATGGTPSYSYALASGSSLPAGLTLGTNGTISGTPTVSGTIIFTVNVTDSTTPAAGTANQTFSITVNQAPTSGSQQSGDYTYTVTAGVAQITKYTGAGGAVTIPSTLDVFPVTSIGDSAFDGCTGITSVSIPQGVTSIGNDAFCYSGVTSINIPQGVTNIGDFAFFNCTGLKIISIVQGVASIGDQAFAYCTGLTSISVAVGNVNYASINGMLFDSSGTSLIACPGGLTNISIPAGVTSIGNYAFKGCTGLTEINIPAGVTSIGNGAISYCTGLTSIKVASDNLNYTSLNNVLFNNLETTLIACPGGLTSIIIPAGVTSIGNYAFNGCLGLTSISIPQGVTNVGDWAFYDCECLTNISIPASVTSIGSLAFDWCTRLASITFNAATTLIVDNAATIPTATEIIGYATSTAQTYAAKYGRTFEAIGSINTLTFTNPQNLPQAVVGTPYNYTFAATGGSGSGYTYSLAIPQASGSSLPAGLTLGTNGTISGTPTASGATSFTVNVTDSATPTAETASQTFNITVNPAAATVNAIDTTKTVAIKGAFNNIYVKVFLLSSVTPSNVTSVTLADGTVLPYNATNGDYEKDITFTTAPVPTSVNLVLTTVSSTQTITLPVNGATTVAISSISSINVTTTAGTVPVLPSTVTATMSDGTTSNVAVTWTSLSSSQYASTGTFTVSGTIAGSSVQAIANVNVNMPNLATINVNVPNNSELVGKYLFQLSNTNGLTQANIQAAMATAPGQDIYLKSCNALWYDLSNNSVTNANDLTNATKAVNEATTIDSLQVLKWFQAGDSVSEVTPSDNVVATVSASTFGSLITVNITNPVIFAGVISFRVYANGAATSVVAPLNTATTVYPAQASGSTVQVEFFNAAGTQVGTTQSVTLE